MTLADAQISVPAMLLGEPTRATMVVALADGSARPASELAKLAGVSLPTTGNHLSRLVAGGLLTVERHGRHKYFRIAGPPVVHALERLAALAPPASVRSLRQSRDAQRLRFARTCYDHLAGALGVALTDALLPPLTHEAGTPASDRWRPDPGDLGCLLELGIDAHRLNTARRPFARACLDWSERRHHLAGALGAAVLTALLDQGHLARVPDSRALRLTTEGANLLTERYHLTVPGESHARF